MTAIVKAAPTPQPTPARDVNEPLIPTLVPSPWLSVAEVAALTGLPDHAVRRHATAGLIPCERMGTRYRFRRVAVEAWLAGQDERATVEPAASLSVDDLVRAFSQLDIVATGPGRWSLVRRGPRAMERWS